MKPMSLGNKVALVITAVLTVVLSLGVHMGPGIWIGGQKHKLLDGAKVGWTRQQVVAHLGEPNHVAHSVREFTGRGSFAPIPTDTVENEVLQYYEPMFRLYVYIGKDGRVTKVFLANT
jgi:hypothetical protein